MPGTTSGSAWHPSLLETAGIGESSSKEEIELAHTDPGRRQARQVLTTGGHGVGPGSRRRATARGRGPLSTRTGWRPVDHKAHPVGVEIGPQHRAVVEHRVLEQLEGDRRAAIVEGALPDTRRRRARHRRCRRRRRCGTGRCRARRPVGAARRRAARGVVEPLWGTGARVPTGTPRWRRTTPRLLGEPGAQVVTLLGGAEDQTAAVHPQQRSAGVASARVRRTPALSRPRRSCSSRAAAPTFALASEVAKPSHDPQGSVARNGRDGVQHRAPQIVGDAIERGSAIHDPTKAERTEGDRTEHGEAAHEPDHADHLTRPCSKPLEE